MGAIYATIPPGANVAARVTLSATAAGVAAPRGQVIRWPLEQRATGRGARKSRANTVGAKSTCRTSSSAAATTITVKALGWEITAEDVAASGVPPLQPRGGA